MNDILLNWKLIQKKGDETDLLELKENTSKHIDVSIGKKIKDGRFGAVATSDKNCADGYWIVEWKNLPYFEDETREMVCDVNWMYSLEYAPHWYHKHVDGPKEDTIEAHGSYVRI